MKKQKAGRNITAGCRIRWPMVIGCAAAMLAACSGTAETTQTDLIPELQSELQEAAGSERTGGNIPSFLCREKENEYTYHDMEDDIAVLAASHGDVVRIDSLGETIDGRELYHILIGDENASDHVLFTASIHGREYITSQMMMINTVDFITGLKENRIFREGITYQDLIKTTVIHIVPMVNPDGVSISQSGLDGIQKEEVRQMIYRIYEMDQAIEMEPYLRRWKANAEGTDINRNFDAEWESYRDPAGHPSADHYKGEHPESTREAQALVRLTNQYPFVRTVSYHAQGEVLYWYFGQPEPLLSESREFTEAVSAVTGYRMDADYESLDPAGYKDWALMHKAIPSITIEVGSGEVPVDPAQLADICRQNENVIPTVLDSVDQQ